MGRGQEARQVSLQSTDADWAMQACNNIAGTQKLRMSSSIAECFLEIQLARTTQVCTSTQ